MATNVSPTMERPAHRWRFFRAGGLDMVRLESAADLENLDQLDQKLWTALACPVKGLEFDEKTLALIDGDGDGRVRAPEIVAAVKWTCGVLRDPTVLVEGSAELPLAAIKDEAIAASAREILANHGRPDASGITLADVTDTAKIFGQTKFNGDGVVTPASAGGDADTAQVITEAVAATGGATDRSGAAGIDAAALTKFFSELAAFDAWTRQGEESADEILPLGAGTAAGVAALDAVATKVDDFFGRCRLAAFDTRAIAALNRQESEFLELAAKDLTITADEISSFPLARVEPGRALPLKDGVNPAWAAAIAALRNAVVVPVYGETKQTLIEEEWLELKAKVAPFRAWNGSKAGAAVAGLGIARVRELLAGDAQAKISALIEQDAKLAPEFAAIAKVEKLVRFNRDLFRLLQNFVAFTDFYDPKRSAVFQAGRLLLDSRSCDLVVRVADAGKHGALAGLSKAYLAYCDCTRPSTGEKMQIAAAFTNGDSDNLMVGRNGIFYDRKGNDWDATITKVIDNPISLRQAFWAPYKKLVRMIEEQVAKRAAAAEAASDAKLASAASAAANVDKTAPAAGAPPKKVDVGTVAAIGVAITGAISALTLILGKLVDLDWWQYPLVFLGLVLLISGPSMLIAALKLRQRNLGPILDANGWAVNGRVKINIPFGTSLTKVAVLPPGSQRTLDDPYAEKKTPWGLYLFLVAVVAGAAWWLRWDALRHNHRYIWQDGRDVPAAEAPATTEAPATPPADATPPTGG